MKKIEVMIPARDIGLALDWLHGTGFDIRTIIPGGNWEPRSLINYWLENAETPGTARIKFRPKDADLAMRFKLTWGGK